MFRQCFAISEAGGKDKDVKLCCREGKAVQESGVESECGRGS